MTASCHCSLFVDLHCLQCCWACSRQGRLTCFSMATPASKPVDLLTCCPDSADNSGSVTVLSSLRVTSRRYTDRAALMSSSLRACGDMLRCQLVSAQAAYMCRPADICCNHQSDSELARNSVPSDLDPSNYNHLPNQHGLASFDQ